MAYFSLLQSRQTLLTGRLEAGGYRTPKSPAPHLPLKRWSQTSFTQGESGGRKRGADGLRAKRVVITRAVFESFTERSIKAVTLAQRDAKAFSSKEVGCVHILLGLLCLDPEACATYLGASATLEAARRAVESLTGCRRRDVINSQDMAFSAAAKHVFEAAQAIAKKQRQNYISPEHILLAALDSGDSGLKQVLNSLHVDLRAAKAAAKEKFDAEQEAEGSKRKAYAGRVKEGGGKAGSGKALQEFCRDLCEEARQQRIDPVIGRDKEVVRVMQILARRSKNNPILLGEPGTGKTAIAEGLAIAIAKGVDYNGEPIPAFLRNKRVLQLDVGLLVSGSKERGELEKRITGILEESLKSGDIILMIDEIHQIIGAGAVGRTSGFAGGGLDLGNLLKPALARARLQVIGATTLREHRQYFEKDAALERRFQPVYVGEPTATEAVDILRGLQDKYERHHKCMYTDEALVTAVALSMRYVADRFLPDKAIDLMDEAGSRARISAFMARQGSCSLAALDAGPNLELQQVLDTKAAYIQEGLWEEAQLLRERELELKQRLSGACYDLPEGAVLPRVEPNDIAAIVSSWTGIPATQLSHNDCIKLLNLAPALKEHVIGQDAAVDSIARAVQRARSGLGDPHRPVATLLFSGPTGVGKTELARSLAEVYFGARDAMVRLDMSEYMERHSVSRLTGAPPGFMGFGEGGALTEAVRRRPHCLLLLDELEKAHPDVFNLLLQIFEDGRLTDSQGRTVSFKHALIVMTSNVGSGHIAGNNSLGFDLGGSNVEDQYHDRIKSLVTEELKAYFRPELLNRLDDIIIFRQLGMDEVRSIADLMLAESSARLLEVRGISLQLTRRLMTSLLDTGYDQEYGARPLKRAISRLVEDPLADAILSGRLQAGDVALLDLAPDNKTVTVKATRSPTDVVVVKSEIVTKVPALRWERESVNISA